MELGVKCSYGGKFKPKRTPFRLSRGGRKFQLSEGNAYNPDRPSPLDSLSDEVIVKILEFTSRPTLVRCAQTCRRLRDIGYDDALWKRMDLGGKVIGPGQAGKIISRGTRVLRYLNMLNFPYLRLSILLMCEFLKTRSPPLTTLYPLITVVSIK